MKFKIFSKTLIATLIIASPLSQATDVTAGIAFTTVPVVSIAQTRAIAFTGGMELASGSTCTMTVDKATNFPSEADGQMSIAGSGDPGEGGAYQGVTGACLAADGIAGIYTVTGGAGVPVKITVKSAQDAFIKYTPAGVIVDYDNAVGSGGDAFDLVTVDTQQEVNIATNDDRNGSVGRAVVGETRIILGGAIEALVALTADTTYPLTFDIDVIY
tara:strand:- start:54518 stop:55162 length:645 start_codon:yes stop_codon:yes gene_type:complete